MEGVEDIMSHIARPHHHHRKVQQMTEEGGIHGKISSGGAVGTISPVVTPTQTRPERTGPGGGGTTM